MSEVLMHSKLRELEEELRVEREIRQKHERDIAHLKLDCDDLDVQLHEANSAKEREIEASKRLRQEIADLKQKIDHQQNDNEESIALLKRKYQETMAELSSHIDSLTKTKIKLEKDNKSYVQQIEELRSENDNLNRTKNQTLNSWKDLESKHLDSVQRIDELLRQLNEVNDLKTKISKENQEYSRRNANMEFELQQLIINNKRLSQEYENTKMQLESEFMIKSSLEAKLKALQQDMDTTSAQLEEESELKLELKKNLAKSHEDFKLYKDKLDKECEARIEEVEDSKRKLNCRFLELQEQFNDVAAKYANIEKSKHKLQSQFDSLSEDYDKTKKKCDEVVKREKALDKEAEELRTKLTIANAELDAAFHSSRTHASELSRYKHLTDQLSEQLETLQKDKRKLSDEFETASTQLLDAQSKLSDLERKCKIIEIDRQQLQNDLDDAKDQIQVETSRITNLNSQMEKLKLETDKKLSDKDDELDLQRTTHRRQLEALQHQLEENDNKHKNDLSSTRKKLLNEIEELKAKYESAKKAKTDSEAQNKKLQQTNKELLEKLNEEQLYNDSIADQLANAERRVSSLKAELEESKTLLDKADKSKKSFENEFHELEEKLNELQTTYNKSITEKKKFEADAISASDELHETKFELKNADDKIRNLNALLLKKEEELRREKELCVESEVARKTFEQQLRDAQARIDESDEHSKREARRINSKLEARLEHVENELELERSREQEYIKEIRRLERKNKELLDQLADDQSRLYSLGEAYDKLQDKMKKCKGQIEGAEEQMAANLSKYKKLHRELEDAEERAETITRSYLRGSSVNRTVDYDSDYADEQTTSHSYSRSHYSKPATLEDYNQLVDQLTTKKPSLVRSKYKSIDIDDDEILAPPTSSRYNKYIGSLTSSFNYQTKTSPWTTNRSDRARSVTHVYETERQPYNTRFKANYFSISGRNSVGRYDDYYEPTVATNKPNFSIKSNRQTKQKAKIVEQSSEDDKIEATSAHDTSITSAAEPEIFE